MVNKKITSRAEDFSKWYLDIIESAELAEHSPVKGCMVIRPNGYAIWEAVQGILDSAFKKTGVQNAYFPLFIPESFLTREAKHVEGFAPEVAVVTHAGGKKLEEPLIVRPTSETIMYEVFSNWIHSYRDLPLLINQWANVVRWEMRTRLFLRTTEFLWQEGHTVHESNAEADARARMMLEIYQDFAENYMAIPVVPGEKTESEKFAGAAQTYTLEAMMQDGKALQFSTSHNLGQNFAKVFNVKFSDKNNKDEFAWQTSWGLSTRVIGALIMAHSDDKGLVLPPKIASIQAVIIPISSNESEQAAVGAKAGELKEKLEAANVKVKVEERDLRSGEKFFYWEKRGVPIRIELGPKDLAAGSCVLVRRDTGEKITVALDKVAETVKALLETIQKDLFQKALDFKKEKTKNVDTWQDFVSEIEKGNFVSAHWSGDPADEAKIKEQTQATIRCIPFDQPEEKGVCIISGKPSNKRVLFARAY